MESLGVKRKSQSPVVGVTWYTEDSWARVKATATDPERFEETFTEWNSMAVDALANIKRAGMNAVKFFIFHDELQSWCQLHNKPNNAASRAEFVSERLRLQRGART